VKIFTSAAQAVCVVPVSRTTVLYLAEELLALSPVEVLPVAWQRVWAIVLAYSSLEL
jgi:hypothetical protein